LGQIDRIKNKDKAFPRKSLHNRGKGPNNQKPFSTTRSLPQLSTRIEEKERETRSAGPAKERWGKNRDENTTLKRLFEGKTTEVHRFKRTKESPEKG